MGRLGGASPPQIPSRRSSGAVERSPAQEASAEKAPSPRWPENSEDREDKKELCVLHAESLELPERGDGVLQRPALTTVALQALQQFVGLHKRFP